MGDGGGEGVAVVVVMLPNKFEYLGLFGKFEFCFFFFSLLLLSLNTEVSFVSLNSAFPFFCPPVKFEYLSVFGKFEFCIVFCLFSR